MTDNNKRPNDKIGKAESKHSKQLRFFILCSLIVACLIWIPATLFELDFKVIYFVFMFLLVITAVFVVSFNIQRKFSKKQKKN